MTLWKLVHGKNFSSGAAAATGTCCLPEVGTDRVFAHAHSRLKRRLFGRHFVWQRNPNCHQVYSLKNTVNNPNKVLQMGTRLTNFWPHLVETLPITNQSTSQWSSTHAWTFCDIFVTIIHLIKILPIDLHANILCVAQCWLILPLDAWRTTHVPAVTT